MINWFKKEKHTEYKDKLREAFPKALRSEVDTVLSILPCDENNVKPCDGQIHKVENLIHPDLQIINLDEELLKILYRVYFNEPEFEKESTLSELQKTILNCIYLRHHEWLYKTTTIRKN